MGASLAIPALLLDQPHWLYWSIALPVALWVIGPLGFLRPPPACHIGQRPDGWYIAEHGGQEQPIQLHPSTRVQSSLVVLQYRSAAQGQGSLLISPQTAENPELFRCLRTRLLWHPAAEPHRIANILTRIRHWRARGDVNTTAKAKKHLGKMPV